MNKNAPIVKIDNWRDDATGDDSFAKVIRSSFGVVGNKTDLIVVAALFVIALVGIAFAQKEGLIAHPRDVAKMVGQWAVLSANVSVAILGFLIAGFSIFATMTRPSLFRFMARYKANGRSISDFKFVFYNFLYIFVHYLSVLAISIITSFMFVPQSPAWFFADRLYDVIPNAVQLSVVIYAAFFIVYVIFSLLLLKSFLWNLYQTLIFAIFFDPPTEA